MQENSSFGNAPPIPTQSIATQSVPQSTWTIRDAFVVGAVLFVVMISVILLQFPLWRFAHPAFMSLELSTQLLVGIGYLAQLLIGGTVAIRIARSHQLGFLLSSINWAPWYLTRAALVGFTVGVGLKFLTFYRSGIATTIHAGPVIALSLISGVILAPLVEECYFRGILFTAVGARFGNLASVVVTSILFALMHPTHILMSLVPALLLGLTRYRTRSVAACVFFHGGMNLAILLIEVFLGT